MKRLTYEAARRLCASQRSGGVEASGAAFSGCGALGIGSIRGENGAKGEQTNDLEKCKKRARFLQEIAQIQGHWEGSFAGEIFPHGVRLTQLGNRQNPLPERSELPPRGQIASFSDKAARRLKEAFLTLHVPGSDLWAYTLTTHRILSPAEWRSAVMRFRQALKERGWPGIWRVELQRRQTPHLHVAFWLPPLIGENEVRELWLVAVRESHDPAAVANAVHSRKIEQNAGGWAVYLGCHNGKHKAEQLGWIGKQWGVWCRDKFTKRKADEFHLSPRQHACFLRVLRNLEVSRKYRLEKSKQDHLLHQISECIPHLLSSIRAPQIPKEKPRLMHRGNLLRLIDGPTIYRIVTALTAGQIYSVSEK